MPRTHAPLLLAFAVTAVGACSSPPDSGTDTRDAQVETDGGGPVACTTDADCAGLVGGPCKTPACDPASGLCAFEPRPDGTACATGGLCRIQETCLAGECQGGLAAPPMCAGKSCGEDACGNVCGTCPAGDICASDATCKPKPVCGDVSYDGCCTAAGTLLFCSEDGQLVELACAAQRQFQHCGWSAGEGYYDCMNEARPEPSGELPWLCPGESCGTPCAGRECGWHCGVACGTCGAGERCTFGGQCEACGCGERTCGDDGCGHSCGACGPGFHCGPEGQCLEQACGGIPFAGCCDVTTLTWCGADGQVATQACGNAGCGWNGQVPGLYDCGFTGADPSGQFVQSCADILAPPADPDPEAVEPGPEAVEPGPEAVEPVPDAGGEETTTDVPEPDPGPTSDTADAAAPELPDATPDAAAPDSDS